MDVEWYYLPERDEVMVNITGVFGVDFESVLAKFEKEFSWTGADYFTEELGDDGEVEQWMYLLGATKRSSEQPTDTKSSTGESLLVSAARNL